MNCQSVRHWLQDAEADEADALFVGEHLETCPDCRALAEAVEAPASVPDSIQPPADLWLGIQTRIDKSIDARQLSAPFGGSRREWQETIGIVMAVAAVVFLALVIRPSLFGAGAGGSVASTGSIMAAAMERECIGAAMELTQQEGAHSLDPQVAALQAQAQEVEQAIRDTRRVIEADETDPRMLTSLARLCRVRLKLAEQTQELARS